MSAGFYSLHFIIRLSHVTFPRGLLDELANEENQ